MAQEKNTPFSDIWAAFPDMELNQQKSIGTQMFAFLRGASLTGAVEILSNAPINIKRHGWRVWSEAADLSGYLLTDILALADSETPEISYAIVKAWLKQANLASCNDEQIVKMDRALVTRQDKIALWQRWSRQADLHAYGFLKLCAILKKMLPEAAIVAVRQWYVSDKDMARKCVRGASIRDIDKAASAGLDADVEDFIARIREGEL